MSESFKFKLTIFLKSGITVCQDVSDVGSFVSLTSALKARKRNPFANPLFKVIGRDEEAMICLDEVEMIQIARNVADADV